MWAYDAFLNDKKREWIEYDINMSHDIILPNIFSDILFRQVFRQLLKWIGMLLSPRVFKTFLRREKVKISLKDWCYTYCMSKVETLELWEEKNDENVHYRYTSIARNHIYVEIHVYEKLYFLCLLPSLYFKQK